MTEVIGYHPARFFAHTEYREGDYVGNVGALFEDDSGAYHMIAGNRVSPSELRLKLDLTSGKHWTEKRS